MAEEAKKPETAVAPAEAKATEQKSPEAGVEAGDTKVAKKKKKSRKHAVLEANIHIYASYNNTIVTVTELNGNSLCWASSGSCGFKGTRKATPYAASIAVETAMNKAKLMGVERVHVSVKGIGSGRDQALRAVNASGVSVETMTDRTAIPHNGCRARKARRV